MPIPLSLATTYGVSFDVFSFRYLDVSVPWVFYLRVSPLSEGNSQITEFYDSPFVTFRIVLRPFILCQGIPSMFFLHFVYFIEFQKAHSLLALSSVESKGWSVHRSWKISKYFISQLEYNFLSIKSFRWKLKAFHFLSRSEIYTSNLLLKKAKKLEKKSIRLSPCSGLGRADKGANKNNGG